MDLPSLADYQSTGDLGQTYFGDTLLPYVDKKGRLRLGYIREIDNDNSRFKYNPVTLNGTISDRSYWKGMDKFEYDMVLNLPPRWILFNEEPLYIAPHGVRQNKKGLTTHTMRSWSPSRRSLSAIGYLELLEYLRGDTYPTMPLEEAQEALQQGDSESCLVGDNIVVTKIGREYRLCYHSSVKETPRWAEITQLYNQLTQE